MTNIRLYALLAALLLGGWKMQAQEPFSIERQSGLFESQKALVSSPTQVPEFVPEENIWLHYDDGIYSTNLAYIPENIPFSWAVMFPPALLQSFDGHALTRVALYENEWNTGDLLLSVYYGSSYQPITLMSQQTVATWPINDFYDMDLVQLVEIDTTQCLWIVFSELTETETYSAACSENHINPNPNARWVQVQKNKWEDVAIYGYPNIQFMIWAYMTDTWGVEKLLSDWPLSVYPNPGRNTLNIHTALQNACVEVYDLSGKLIFNHEITGSITSINTENWPAGVYIWKVYTNQAGPSTLRWASGTAGSGTLVETGKWIKE